MARGHCVRSRGAHSGRLYFPRPVEGVGDDGSNFGASGEHDEGEARERCCGEGGRKHTRNRNGVPQCALGRLKLPHKKLTVRPSCLSAEASWGVMKSAEPTEVS